MPHRTTDPTEHPGTRRPRDGSGFLTRWALAISLSMVVAGGLEYVVASRQLVQRTLEESLAQHQTHVPQVEEVLASPVPPQDAQVLLQAEMEEIAEAYAVLDVVLFDAAGRPVASAGVGASRLDELEPLRADLVRSVVEHGEPVVADEQEDGEREEARYEFLMPLSGPDGPMVLEVDQRAEVISSLLSDLRQRKVLTLLLALLCALPLSYLLGGRALHLRQRRAERTASTDALTGLEGRRPFRPSLQAALEDPSGAPVSLALVDVDEFKQVNDRLGHSYGDRVLVSLAEAFAVLRSSDTAYRLGGDEFAVVLRGGDEEQAVEALERVRRALAERVPGVTFSCGIASTPPGGGMALQELWERADAALYGAKRRGRRQTVTSTAMSAQLLASSAELEAVSSLLAEPGGLTVVFQPVWDLVGGGVLGHEALVRLPPGSPVSGPEQAFALAQRLGVAAELDARARRATLRAVRGLDWHGLLFLNVHPDALPSLDPEALATEVAGAGLLPSDVVLEVTEHAGLDDHASIAALVGARELGFRLGLDDMGHGNAGLRALTRVRFDVLKIDRDVTALLGTDPASDATVAAATTFVQRSGGWVIAEGIEDLQMLQAVTENSHDRSYPQPALGGQGYLLGRPSPSPVPPGATMDQLAATDPLTSV